jgi:hypothetical protein
MNSLDDLVHALQSALGTAQRALVDRQRAHVVRQVQLDADSELEGESWFLSVETGKKACSACASPDRTPAPTSLACTRSCLSCRERTTRRSRCASTASCSKSLEEAKVRKRNKTLLIALSEAESDALREIIGTGEVAGTDGRVEWIERATLQVLRTVQRLFFWKARQA